jgi:gliding motility-associated-like protein
MKQFTFKIFFLFLLLTSVGAQAQSVGGTTSGAVSYCSTTNAGFISVTGYVGSILGWESSTNGGATWNPIANTTPNQTYFNLAQTTCYRAIVQNGAFPPDTSTIACITIYAPSVGGTISGGGTFCASTGPGTLTLSGYTGSILYWQSSTNGGSTWTTIANTTDTETYTNITTSTIYWAIVQNGSMCPTDTSSQVSFIVDPATVPGTISGASSVCSSGNSGNLTLGGYTGTILGWSYSITGGASWIPLANTTATQSYLNLSTTTIYHAIVQSGSCPADSSNDFTITVSSPTVPGTLSGGGVFCGVPGAGTLTLAGSTGSVVGWLSSTNGGATWTPIANTTTTETYSGIITETWYTVIVQSGGCPADSSNIEIVDAAPATVAGTLSGTATVCYLLNNGTVDLNGQTGNVLGWLMSTDAGTTWLPLANTTDSLVYSGLTQDTWYQAIVQSGSCSIDTTATLIISVYPPFVVNAGNDTTIFEGQSVTLNGSGSGIPAWLPSATLDNAAVFAPVASPVTTTTYTLYVTDVNGCVNSDDVVITVSPSTFSGMISNLFTPNGDGINDNWYIEGIQNYPDNEVFIYNIYGNEVYKKQGYTNDWQGTHNGSDLPDGTYFFVLRFEKQDKVLKGSIDLLRK